MLVADTPILIELQYCAPVGYYARILPHRTVWIEQQEHYIKGSFRNRCHIATASGVLRLSIPLLKGKHQQMPIRQTAIDNTTDWQTIHWRGLQTAYGKAPFWQDYAPLLAPIYAKKYIWLWDICWDMQQTICRLLQLKTNFILTEEFWQDVPPPFMDARNSISPKVPSPFAVFPTYPQLFLDRQPFLPNLSILDLLFCMGNEAQAYLRALHTT